jgi:hypothetical protein
MHPAARLLRRSLLPLTAIALVAPVVPTSIAHAATAAVAQELPTLPIPTAALAQASGTAIDVSWVSVGDPHRWKVLAFSDGRYVGQRTFAGAARSGRVEHLAPGTSITAWVVPISAQGGWGGWVTTLPVVLPRSSACPLTSGTCVHVDGAGLAGPATGVGLGFLHGITTGTDPARVSALSPRHWRVSALDAPRFQLARAAGASVTAVLSDPWAWHTTQADGRVASPWASWELYRWWVSLIAQWHVEQGLVPDRWEIQNEPSDALFDAANPPTIALLVEQHRVAAEAIRSVIPDAKIVGLSVSPVLFGHGLQDLEGFVTEAAAQHVDLDGIAWHENIGACSTCDGGPTAVLQHVDDARAALRAAGLADLPIDITELAAPYEQLQPGAIVGYLRALTEGGVRFGGTACWERPTSGGAVANSCFDTPGTLDSLLLADGRTPTDAWWTYRAYAQLAGAGARLVRTSVDDPATSAVASINGATVRTLVGRHTGCTAADGPCPAGTTPGPRETVTLRMTAPTAGSWDIVVSKITSNSGASAGPTVLRRTTMTAGTTPFTVGAFAVADGDVLQMDATPTPVRTSVKRR